MKFPGHHLAQRMNEVTFLAVKMQQLEIWPIDSGEYYSY